MPPPTANQQPKRNNHKAKKSGSEDCIYFKYKHYSFQIISSKLERPSSLILSRARSGTSNSNVKSNKFENSNKASQGSLRRARVRNNENAADLKDFNSVYGSSLVFSKHAGKQFIINSNSELSSIDSKNVYYIYENKDEDLLVSIHSAHGQEDEPEELVITDLSRMEQTHVFYKQLSNKDTFLLIYAEEMLSRLPIWKYSFPIHPDQSRQLRSYFPVNSRHSVSEKVDNRLRTLIANVLTGVDSTTYMTDKSEFENLVREFTEKDEDVIKSYSRDIDSSTFPQEIARKVLLEKIFTESFSSKSINFIEAEFSTKVGHLGSKQMTDVIGHQELVSAFEKFYGFSKSEEKESVSKKQKQPDYSGSKKKQEKNYRRTFQRTRLTYEEIQQRVAVARTRVVQQRQKLQYCAISANDFERAWQICMGLKSEDFWMMLKSWPSNYRFPIDIPSLYPLCLMTLLGIYCSYVTGEDNETPDSDFSGEEAGSNSQVTPPENLENIGPSPVNEEDTKEYVLEPLEEPYDQENGFLPNVELYRIL